MESQRVEPGEGETKGKWMKVPELPPLCGVHLQTKELTMQISEMGTW